LATKKTSDKSTSKTSKRVATVAVVAKVDKQYIPHDAKSVQAKRALDSELIEAMRTAREGLSTRLSELNAGVAKTLVMRKVVSSASRLIKRQLIVPKTEALAFVEWAYWSNSAAIFSCSTTKNHNILARDQFDSLLTYLTADTLLANYSSWPITKETASLYLYAISYEIACLDDLCWPVSEMTVPFGDIADELIKGGDRLRKAIQRYLTFAPLELSEAVGFEIPARDWMRQLSSDLEKMISVVSREKAKPRHRDRKREMTQVVEAAAMFWPLLTGQLPAVDKTKAMATPFARFLSELEESLIAEAKGTFREDLYNSKFSLGPVVAARGIERAEGMRAEMSRHIRKWRLLQRIRGRDLAPQMKP
jgi:hypothetical protein